MSSFHEISFPQNIAYRSAGGPGFSTSIVRKASGDEERVAAWSYPLHRYDVRFGIRSYQHAMDLRDFYIRRLGPAHGFRFRDPLDFTTQPLPTMPKAYRDGSAYAFNDVQIGTGDGTTKIFQLSKKYSDATVVRTRNITKPVSGKVKSGVNGAEKGITTDWTVDVTTGLLSYLVAPPNGHAVTAGFEFDVPVRFDDVLDEAFMVTATDFGGAEGPPIPLVEIANGGIVADEDYMGDAAELTFSADVTITPNTGRVLRLTPGIAGLSLRLPATTDLVDGVPWFLLKNNHATNALTVKDSAGASLFTLAALSGVTVGLGTFGGVKTWVAA